MVNESIDNILIGVYNNKQGDFVFVKRILDKEKNSRIRIVGIDNLGNEIVDKLHDLKYQKIVITPNMSDAYGIPDTKLIIGYNINKGLCVGDNEKLSQDIFNESYNEIEDLLINHSEYINDDNIIFTGGAGNTLFSSVIISILELNRKLINRGKNISRKTIVIVSTPFKWEGTRRNEIADSTINRLKDLEKNHFIDELIVIKADDYNSDSAGIINNYNKLVGEVCKKIYSIIDTL